MQVSTNRNRWRIAALSAAAAWLAIAGAAAQSKPTPAEAAQAFATVQKVLQHPRCQNCHIPGDAPLQFDEGRTHAQNVKRGADGKGVAGMNCATCHTAANAPAAYGDVAPPGAPNWHLPPEKTKMVFKDLSGAELCGVLKNKASNGNRDLAALVEHVSHDKLVLWGWAPGGRRAPVPVSHADFVAQFKIWVAAGAPCPGR
jgi:mono/diheme cytochrome c family protein